MKRKNFLALSAIAPLSLAASPGALARQEPVGDDKPVRPKRRRSTPAESREMDAAVEMKSFDLSSLSVADRRKALQMADAISALMLKAFLSRRDPAVYRLSANPDSLERKVDAVVKTLSPKTLARLDRLTRSPTETRKKLRGLSDIDLKAELTPATLRLPAQRSKNDEESVNTPSLDVRRQVCAAGKYNRLTLILQRIHCNEETDGIGGSDEMFLSGLMVGASGSAKTMGTVNCGDFDSGEGHSYGMLPIGSFNLNTTNHYPKDFFVIFQLVESDSSDAATARDLTKLLKGVVEKVLDAFGGQGYSAMVGAIISAVGGFIASMFGDDYFPHYGVYLQLNSENQFGGNMSGYWRTEKIKGHGGSYQIGFRWMFS